MQINKNEIQLSLTKRYAKLLELVDGIDLMESSLSVGTLDDLRATMETVFPMVGQEAVIGDLAPHVCLTPGEVLELYSKMGDICITLELAKLHELADVAVVSAVDVNVKFPHHQIDEVTYEPLTVEDLKAFIPKKRSAFEELHEQATLEDAITKVEVNHLKLVSTPYYDFPMDTDWDFAANLVKGFALDPVSNVAAITDDGAYYLETTDRNIAMVRHFQLMADDLRTLQRNEGLSKSELSAYAKCAYNPLISLAKTHFYSEVGKPIWGNVKHLENVGFLVTLNNGVLDVYTDSCMVSI